MTSNLSHMSGTPEGTTHRPPSGPGHKYPTHDPNAPMFEGIDIVGFVVAVIITLGPLAAYSLGLGA